jgi:hypothetical protein
MGKSAVMKISGVCLLICLLVLGIIGIAFGENAGVLPKGVSRFSMQYWYAIPFDERYNPDGDVEPAAIDYNGTLSSNVFPALQAVESFFGMIPGSANIGDSVVSFEYEPKYLWTKYAYGITDKIAVELFIPYMWIKNNVDARLDTTNATVGKSAIGAGFGAPVVPCGVGCTNGGPFGDAVPLTTEDALNLIGPGIDIDGDGQPEIPGYDFKRFETWSDQGIKDIELTGKYQYYKSDTWRLAFTGGVRFPTGEVNDPDNLVDIGFGSGAWALLFKSHNDYTRIKNLVLNATITYDLVLPDKETLRVRDDVNQPLTRNKEEVDRNYGDAIGIDTSVAYKFPKGFGAALQYLYGHSFEDEIDGDEGFMYDSLEQETEGRSHSFAASISYSTVQLFMEKKFPVPFSTALSYRNRFAGKDNVYKSEYLGLGLQVFF